MSPLSYSITFACYNAVKYTRLCVESMQKHGTPLDRLIVVDNGSSDDTREYLKSLPLGERIFNKQNLGCGVAWNQGVLAQQAEWSIVMNNDVLVSPGWIEALIGTAQAKGLKIVSPALIEGPLDYDFEQFAPEAARKMKSALRIGNPHAVCLAVHESVWADIGYFQAMPKLWGFEDTMFFHAAKQAGIPMATTGASWLHHFGSITQSASSVVHLQIQKIDTASGGLISVASFPQFSGLQIGSNTYDQTTHTMVFIAQDTALGLWGYDTQAQTLLALQTPVNDLSELEADNATYAAVKYGTTNGVAAEVLPNRFVAFPNPTTDRLYLRLPEHVESASFMVVDAQGLQVVQGNIARTTDFVIDVHTLSAGIYFVRGMAEGQVIVGSFSVGTR